MANKPKWSTDNGTPTLTLVCGSKTVDGTELSGVTLTERLKSLAGSCGYKKFDIKDAKGIRTPQEIANGNFTGAELTVVPYNEAA
jgi:hypothetical protein